MTTLRVSGSKLAESGVLGLRLAGELQSRRRVVHSQGRNDLMANR